MKFSGWSRCNLLLRTIIVFGTLFLLSVSILNSWYSAVALLIPILAAQFIFYINYNQKAQEEIRQFVESVHYRDFSRHFEVQGAPPELQAFRSGFNEINSIFKLISKEKETQYLHLKTILEIVDTGILSYEIEKGDILWMNEWLKCLLDIPYLKTVHSLEKRNEPLYRNVLALSTGNNVVATIYKNNVAVKLLLSATTFENDGKKYRLIAFQNINEALEENESKAWQKLLSVMTHEIMNSVAPIASLAETLNATIRETIIATDGSRETLLDIETGINTIKKRSEGLLRFSETYRHLSKINKVNLATLPVIEIFEHVQQIMQPTIDKGKIEFEVILRDPFLNLKVDTNLIEQALINLILNSIDALRGVAMPRIQISAEPVSDGKIVLKVSDNGSGISDEVKDSIFIPFFTTKKTGSGIGLSLCKQIMLLHKGSIQVRSSVSNGTVVSLVFNDLPGLPENVRVQVDKRTEQ